MEATMIFFMSREEKEKRLKILEDAIDEIYLDPHTTNCNDRDLYLLACDLVDEDCEQRLHELVKNAISRRLETVSEALRGLPDSGEFLKELNERYGDHKRAIERLGNILMLTDMDYAEKLKQTLRTEVHEIGHAHWKAYVIDSTQILTRIVDTLLDLIHRERSGECDDVSEDVPTFQVHDGDEDVGPDNPTFQVHDSDEDPGDDPTSRLRDKELGVQDAGDNVTFHPCVQEPAYAFEVYNTHWHPALASPSCAGAVLGPSDQNGMDELNSKGAGLEMPSVQSRDPNSDGSGTSATPPPPAVIVDHVLMRGAVMMIVDMDYSIYERAFETPFLQASAEFYAAESRKLIELGDGDRYLRKVERSLDEEVKRVYRYLYEGTLEHITRLVVTEMLTKHMETLFLTENAWFKGKLTSEDYDVLSRAYDLLSLVPDGVWPIRSAMTLHVEEAVRTQLLPLSENETEKHKPSHLSSSTKTMKDKYTNLIKKAFKGNPEFHQDFDSAFNGIEELFSLIGSW